jgi:hypothetical protein
LEFTIASKNFNKKTISMHKIYLQQIISIFTTIINTKNNRSYPCPTPAISTTTSRPDYITGVDIRTVVQPTWWLGCCSCQGVGGAERTRRGSSWMESKGRTCREEQEALAGEEAGAARSRWRSKGSAVAGRRARRGRSWRGSVAGRHAHRGRSRRGRRMTRSTGEDRRCAVARGRSRGDAVAGGGSRATCSPGEDLRSPSRKKQADAMQLSSMGGGRKVCVATLRIRDVGPSHMPQNSNNRF